MDKVDSTSTSNIILVESEQSLRQKLADALDPEWFTVAEAPDYFEALWLIGDVQPDLVILNEELPYVNGWQACEQIKQTFGIPVIILGASRNPHKWENVLEAGAEYYLRVPFKPLEFNARIKSILRRYRQKPA